jgi:uncharacterized protein YecE (DUF72 family)
MTRLRLGTAGWSIPRDAAEAFPAQGSLLERYAARLDAVEINTTFYRPHMPRTFERWAASTPPDFRFAVKLARSVTHEARLSPAQGVLEAAVGQALLLGAKLGPLLIQLPPSLTFHAAIADRFFARLRTLLDGPVVCEPRHLSWFGPEPEALLAAHRVARAAADPAVCAEAARPGGWPGLAYWRLHGSPRIYFSAYGPAFLKALAQAVDDQSADEVWCIFDNTASGAAMTDTLRLQTLLASGVRPLAGF